jgi:rsbT co-antagonist protein RsbR
MTVELLMKTLDRLPGAVSVSRADAATGKIEVLYMGPNGPGIYGVTRAELLADPTAVMQRMVPEERAQLEAQLAVATEKLTPVHWSGRIVHPNGDVRWIEINASIEREPGGSSLAYAQGVDVTDRRRTEDALVESEDVRRRSDALHRAVIDALPVGVVVMDLDGGFPIVNAAQQRLSGTYDEKAQHLKGDELMQRHGMFKADGVTPFPMSEAPVALAIAGEKAQDIEIVVRSSLIEGEVRMLSQARAIHDGSGKIIAAVAVCVDITAQRELEKELVNRNEQLAESEEAKTVLIERLRLAIDELSNPILEVWDDVLAMPIIGLVDSRRTADMVRRLLAEVARTQASFVIVDLTGVEIVDTKTADHLMKLMRKVEIVGARCVLTGVRPAVAETLVDIGVDFGRLATLRNLKHGLREALRYARREREGLRDVLGDDDQAGRIGAATPRSQNGGG